MDLLVTEEAIDELHHVNNSVYLQYVELIARAHAVSVGLTTECFIELGGVFVVRRHEVIYFAPAHAGDRLTLGTWIEKNSGPRCNRVVEIWRGEQRIVEATTEWVWLEPTTRTPKRIPAEVLIALPPVPF